MKVKTLQFGKAMCAALFILLLVVAGMKNALAQDFTVGDLNYSINGDGVSVTVTGHVDGQNATGELVIPESVELYGTTYSVTGIGDDAFYNCYGLTGSLIIPETVTIIGSFAFMGCGFETLTISSNMMYIEWGAFWSCSLTTLNWNAINSYCYYSTGSSPSHWLEGCPLSTINIGENVQVIPVGFLAGFSSITGELVIPQSVTTIGSNAFYGCSGFSGSLTVSEAVTSIGENAFSGCSGLSGSLTIPNNVTSIGANAFSGCSGLSGTLTLGTSLSEIGNSAFFGACGGFSSFDVKAEVPPTLGTNVFASANTNIPVSVPCGTLDAYQNANGWSTFTNIQETNPCQWTISATAQPSIGGTISGAGTYEQGQNCTLTAVPQGDFEFSRWTEDDLEVSTNATYSFTVEGNRTLVAHFTNPNFIVFADPDVEAICLYYWDTDNDGYLSYAEASAVTNLGGVFYYNTEITSFDELQYFTGLTNLNDYEFRDCHSLTSITLPENITYIGYYAFAYCYSLSTINMLSVTPPEPNWCAFCEIYSNYNIIISVPCGATGSYQSIDGWNGFTNYQEPNTCVYEIVATANNDNAGTVSGSGSYQRGQSCTLTAIPAEGHNFVRWMENGQEVSTSATYTFTVMGPRNLVAAFSAPIADIIVFADPNVEAICVSHWDTDGDSFLSYAEAAAVTNLEQAFYYHSEITSFDELQYFTGLTHINYREFYNCYNLTSVILPEGITSIGAYAFCYCSSLTGELVIPNSVTEIQYNAFYGCDGFNGSLTIGANVNSIGSGAFGYAGFTTVNYNAINCSSLEGWLWNPETITTLNIGENVEVIPYGAFSYFSNLTGDLVIPNSVTSIGDDAFSGCSSLTSVALGNSLTSIGYSAFNSCSGLASIVIPNSVTEIGSWAFGNCSSLTSASLPEGMTSINEGVFGECPSLTSVVFPSALETIGHYAFQSCGLTSLELPNTVTSIGIGAFSNCTSISGTLDLPASVTTIGEEAFYNCTGLQSIVLPEDLHSIGSRAFKNCSGLRGELTLSESLESVGGEAFYGCDGISTVNYNAINCQYMGNAGAPVFYDCAFTRLNIGENVTTIPNFAFKRCFMLTEMTVGATVPPTIYSSTFGMVSRSIPVSVPYGTGDAYRSAPYWEEFFNITDDYTPTQYAYHWSFDIHDFEYNMTVVGVIHINGAEQETNALEIGAFCGDECRGRQMLAYHPVADRYVVFLMIYGNPNDLITFRLYDHAIGEESTMNCANFITFEADASLGTLNSPYVFNFGNTMQTTTFSLGWNWWSTYLETQGYNSLAMLEEGLGENGIQIKSQSDFVQYLEVPGYGGYWYGTLDTILSNEQTYKVQTSAACQMVLNGTPVSPADHPITILPGWNWIGFPSSSAISFAEAFANFTPTDGDQVKSQSGFTQYMEIPGYGGIWYGGLEMENLTPGMGLMYKSMNSGNATLVYPNAGRSVENVSYVEKHWTNDVHAYSGNMTLMAVVELDNVELASDNYELAAFADGECRGSARLTYVEPLNRYFAFLTIAGDEATELYFGLYDHTTGEESFESSDVIVYTTDASVGSSNTPMIVRFRGTTGLDDLESRLHVYPNPVACGQQFSIGFDDIEAQPVRVEIVNALGVTVAVETSRQMTAPKTAGVYMLRVFVEGKDSCVRKLVVK